MKGSFCVGPDFRNKLGTIEKDLIQDVRCILTLRTLNTVRISLQDAMSVEDNKQLKCESLVNDNLNPAPLDPKSMH